MIKIAKPSSTGKKYAGYKQQVLERALELSTPEFGPYEIQMCGLKMKTKRALIAMQNGEAVNVAAFAASYTTDQLATPVRVPVRGGMVGYKLLLVNRDDIAKFSDISSAQELRQLTAGTQDHLMATTVLERDNYSFANAHNFEGMFVMLSNRRSDYIPRSVYEVYEDYQSLQEQDSSIVIAPSIAMFIPMVSYFYVSPKEKRLAQRLELGMKRLSESGELKDIFASYYANDIVQANFAKRTIIEVKDDYFLSQQQFFTPNMLWPADSFEAKQLH